MAFYRFFLSAARLDFELRTFFVISTERRFAIVLRNSRVHYRFAYFIYAEIFFNCNCLFCRLIDWMQIMSLFACINDDTMQQKCWKNVKFKIEITPSTILRLSLSHLYVNYDQIKSYNIFFFLFIPSPFDLSSMLGCYFDAYVWNCTLIDISIKTNYFNMFFSSLLLLLLLLCFAFVYWNRLRRTTKLWHCVIK